MQVHNEVVHVCTTIMLNILAAKLHILRKLILTGLVLSKFYTVEVLLLQVSSPRILW